MKKNNNACKFSIKQPVQFIWHSVQINIQLQLYFSEFTDGIKKECSFIQIAPFNSVEDFYFFVILNSFALT